MNIARYLERIGYDGDPTPTLETLRAMHRAHFYSVPFENLDIGHGVRIDVDVARSFDKVVARRRGGWCMELNALFATALRAIGFTLDVFGARVLFEGRLGPPMSHMVILVHLADEEWIADVGFGGRIAGPLRLDEREEQCIEGRTYVIADDVDRWFVTCLEDGAASAMYLFAKRPHAFEDFRPVCEWLQTSPDSRFTKGDIVSLATPAGRKTFAGGRFIVTEEGRRDERDVASSDERRRILQDHFGLVLGT